MLSFFIHFCYYEYVMNKKGYNLVQVIIIMIIVAIASSLTTGAIFSRSSKRFSGFTDDESLQEFLSVYSDISNDYFENIDKNELINSAIKGMSDYLEDKYTTYLNQDDADSLMDSLAGSYKGIGVRIMGNLIIEVFAGSSAESIGLKVGDEIVSINGEETANLSSEEVSKLITNKSNVHLEVKRDDEALSFDVNLSNVKINNVYSKVIDDTNIGYMQISVFSENLSKDVEDALKKLESQNIKSLIIDLRNNTGGFLDEAYNIACFFTDNGKIIYSLLDKDAKTDVYDEDNQSKDYKVVILVNGSTASASEILTAALKENYGAIIVGQNTYGKGKVQHTYTLSSGGLFKYTSSKWLTPSGNCIDGIGIAPDYEVANKYIVDENNEIIGISDEQLLKAVELLK